MNKFKENDYTKQTMLLLRSSYDNEKFSDLMIIFKDGERSASSLLFLLTGNFWKKLMLGISRMEHLAVYIPDVSVEEFDHVFDLITTGNVFLEETLVPIIQDTLSAIFPDVNLDPCHREQKRFDVGKNPFVCPHCLKEFSRKEKCLNHIESYHKQKFIKCDRCEKVFRTKNGMERHKLTHLKPQIHYICPTCGKAYKHHKDLIRHIECNKHDYPEENVYSEYYKPPKSNCHSAAYCPTKCDICHKYFDDINYHKTKVHSEDPITFKCDLCKYTTTRKDNLQRHELRRHKISTRKFQYLDKTYKNKEEKIQYECFDCNENLSSLPEIENHLLSKSCNKCETCDKTFGTKHALKQHNETIHVNPQTYTCSNCGKTFKHKPSLTKHFKKCK